MTRRRILAAALELAGREGLGALTSRRLAAEAGVTLGLLHYHFGSMSGLVEETLAAFFDEVWRRLEAGGIARRGGMTAEMGDAGTIGGASEAGEERGTVEAGDAGAAGREEEALVTALEGILELGQRRPGLLLAAIAGAGRELAESGARSEAEAAAAQAAGASAAGDPVAGAQAAGASAAGATGAGTPFETLLRRLPPARPGAGSSLALELYRGLSSGVRTIIARRLGPGREGEASGRSLRLLCSVLHPVLLSPLPALLFGIDLGDAAARGAYVAAAVAEALGSVETDPSISADGKA